jgi:hypothetical protein
MMRMITAIMEERKWSPSTSTTAPPAATVGYSLITKKGDSHVVAGATPMIVSGKLQGRLSGNHRDAIPDDRRDRRADARCTPIRRQDAGGFHRRGARQAGPAAVGGTGTHNGDHIFAHLLEQSAKIKLKCVPFNSGGEATAALVGGHIDAGVMNPEEIVAQVEAGRRRTSRSAAQSA